MNDILCLNKEIIIKEENSPEDEHDGNDPQDILQVKACELDKGQYNSNQTEDNFNTNDNQQTIQEFNSDEDLAAVRTKLAIDQQNPTHSHQMMQDFDADEDLSEIQKIHVLQSKRPTVRKPPTLIYQPTLSKECAICQKYFVYRQDFIDHARKYHPNKKAFRCSVCSMVFVNIHSVSRHSKNHKDKVKKHICEYCFKSFLHRDSYKRHIETHTRGKIYTCSVCGISYKHKVSLENHKKTHLEIDDNNKQISIEENVEEDVSLTNTPSIKQEEHKTTASDLQTDLAMNSAMDVTKTEYVEEGQLLEVQNQGEIYKIEYIDEQHKVEQFENNSNTNDTEHLQMPDTNLTNEDQTITDTKQYRHMSTVDTKCAVCHQDFAIRQDLVDHVQQYHPYAKAFKCIICSMRFSNILSVARHRRVHKNMPGTGCPYCSKSFLNLDDYKRHITKVHSVKIANNLNQPAVDRKCAICHEEFVLRQDLIKHAQEFHPKEKAFKCTICSMVFTNIHYISRHRRNHKVLPRKYNCEFCFKSFRDLDNFKRHLKLHNVGTRYQCSLCNVFFRYKDSLRNHELVHMAIGDVERTPIESNSGNKTIEGKSDKNYEEIRTIQNHHLKPQRAVETKCAVCKQEFKYRQDLMKHVQQEHPNDRAFKCSVCPRVFKNIHYLSTHRRIHKNLPRKHVCKICSKTFRDQDNFTRHLKLHMRTHVYACNLCDKSYKYPISLENHKKTHLEKPSKAKEDKVKKMRKPISANFQRPVEMKCAVCQQKFDYRFELVNHVQSNHPNAKAYKCGLCPMVFANIVAVSHHRNIHKVFECKLCSKSFTCKEDLKLHIRIHTKERPYCCFICKTNYKRRDSWLKHKTSYCKSLKDNNGEKTENLNVEINKSLETLPDINLPTNSNVDCKNELEMKSEYIEEDEKILPVESDKEIEKSDQLEDNFNTKVDDDNDDDDGSVFEKNTNQKKTRPMRLSALNKKYTGLEDNSDTDDSQKLKRTKKKDDDDYCNDDEEEEEDEEDDEEEDGEEDDDDEKDDYNVDNDADFGFGKKTNQQKTRTKLSTKKDENIAVQEDNSDTNDSQQIILTDEEDDNEDYNHDSEADDYDYNDENDFILHEQTNKKTHSMLAENTKLSGQEDNSNSQQIIITENDFDDLVSELENNMSAVDKKCAVCHQEVESRKMLTKHAEKYHPNEDVFKCNVCLLLFKSIHAISSHVRSHGRQIIDKKCGVCHKEFPARHELIKHTKESHPNERAIKCALCPRLFKSITCISSHRRSHKNMPKKYVCNACNTSYSELGNYKCHLKSLKHKIFTENRQKIMSEEACSSAEFQDIKRKHVCPYCCLTLTHEDDFKRHLNTHSAALEYKPQLVVEKKCAVCQKEFQGRQDLIDHAKKFHPNGKSFKCALCPLVFQHIMSISGHRRRVHKQYGQRKHFCKVCKKFVSLDSVRNHLKSRKHIFFMDELQKTISKRHSKDVGNDNLCKTTTSNEKNKETSVENCQEIQSKKESNEVINKSIISNEIDKDTLSNCYIKEEIDLNIESKDALEVSDVYKIYQTELNDDAEKREDNVLIDDDDFALEKETSLDWTNLNKCKICGKSFVSQAHLRRHFSKHSVERPYQCSFCDRRYKRKDDMKTHQRRFHFKLLISLAEKTIEAGNTEHLRAKNDKQVLIPQTERILTNHLKERPFKCSLCYRRFNRKVDLETHKKNVHLELLPPLPEKPIDKEDNLKGIKDKEVASSHWRSHLSMHSKERPFKCSFCYRRYSRKDFMRAHQKKIHPDRFKKTINKEKYLKVLNDKKIEKVYDKVIVATPNQNKETIKIDNEALRPNICKVLKDMPTEHVCKICNISCSSASNLNRHYLAHSNVRPFDCSYCTKSFKRKDDKKAHEKRIHNKQFIADQNKKAKAFVAALIEDNSNTSTEFEDDSHRFARLKNNPNTLGDSNTASKRPKSSLNYEDSIHSHNLGENTSNIAEEPFPVNVLEISKSEYVFNEAMSFQISHDIKNVEDPINPGNEVPTDSLNPLENFPNKTIDLNKCEEEDVELYQANEKCLSNEDHFDKAIINDNERLTESLTNLPSTSQNLVKKYACEKCPKSFYSKTNLKRHYRNHGRKKSRKPLVKGLLAIDPKCAVCKKEFICRQDFIKHAELYHPKDKAFKCNLCPMRFSNVSSIPRHRRKFHEESTTEKFCLNFSKQYNRTDNFQKHLQKNRRSTYNSTAQDLSFNEDTDEETMSSSSQDNNSINESLNSSVEYEQTNRRFNESELESVNNSEEEDEEEAEEVENMKNSFKIKETHHTDNDSQDDSDIEEDETSTNYSQKNAYLSDKSTNYSHQNAAVDEESISETSSNTKCRKNKKPPMLDNKCVICFQIFDFHRDLIQHAQQCHPSEKALKCRVCAVTFSHHGSVYRHFRIHKKLTKKYVCEFCFKAFPFKDYLKTHLRIHYTVKGAHPCNLCDRSYKHLDSLVSHQKTHSQQETNECNKEINISKKVKDEESTTTTSSNVESDQAKEAKYLENNSAANETKEDEIFKNISETLIKLKSRHKLEGKCPICKMVIKSYQDFVQHLENVHPEFEVFKCKMCDNRFSNTNSLSSHMNSYHIQTTKKHICEICSKSFYRASELKSHLNIHTDVGEKSFKDNNQDVNNYQMINLQTNSKDLDEDVEHSQQHYEKPQLMQTTDIKEENMNLNIKQEGLVDDS